MLTEHSRSAPACSCNFSPSMDLSMASSFLWFMPCYHPRPEQITTGCLHTSRKSYRIEACRWVHRAVIQSLAMQLPGVEIQGCYFHFSQCLWRKVQALRMADLYKNDVDTRNLIHKAAALPFIPPRFIRIWLNQKHPRPVRQMNSSDTSNLHG